MPQWYDERTEEWCEYYPIEPGCEISDDPAVLATLLGPDGEPMVVLFDRDTVPFGFQRSENDDDDSD